MWYNFQTKAEADKVVKQINLDLGLPKENNIFKGKGLHKIAKSDTYCKVKEHSNGWAIKKDRVTEKYCDGVDTINFDEVLEIDL